MNQDVRKNRDCKDKGGNGKDETPQEEVKDRSAYERSSI